MKIEVRDEPDPGRYVIEVDGKGVGFTDYHVRGGHIYFFVHTEIKTGFEGLELGSKLIRHALDDVRSRGATVIPLCPFVRGFIERHSEYQDLIEQPMWDRINDRSGREQG